MEYIYANHGDRLGRIMLLRLTLSAFLIVVAVVARHPIVYAVTVVFVSYTAGLWQGMLYTANALRCALPEKPPPTHEDHKSGHGSL